MDDDALAAEQLHRLADLAGESGVRVAYEALAWGRHVSTWDHAWRIVEAAARFEFADGELETYRDLGILYDRDVHGVFRHCCTRTVGRVFVALVQRDGGYRGATAPPTPRARPRRAAGRRRPP